MPTNRRYRVQRRTSTRLDGVIVGALFSGHDYFRRFEKDMEDLRPFWETYGDALTVEYQKQGEVSCYPYRCRAGRCLLSCQTRKDCAGSEGPAEMATHGWPLDCASSRAECYPLPPDHVHGR